MILKIIYIYIYTLEFITVPEVSYVVKLGVDIKWRMYIGFVKEIKENDKTAQQNCIIHKLKTNLLTKSN
jgi:hypothetical protein